MKVAIGWRFNVAPSRDYSGTPARYVGRRAGVLSRSTES